MLKKILFSLLTILLVYSGAIVGYKAHEPDKSALCSYMLLNNNESLDYNTIEDYTLNSGASSIHYYMFYDEDGANSAYLENTILKELAKDPLQDFTTLLEYVNVPNLSDPETPIKLQKKWGIDTLPALLVCRVQDHKIVIESTLQWNEKEPLTSEDVKMWMMQNGLFTYDESAQPITLN